MQCRLFRIETEHSNETVTIWLILQLIEEHLPLTCDVGVIGDLNDQSSTCKNALIRSASLMVTLQAL